MRQQAYPWTIVPFNYPVETRKLINNITWNGLVTLSKVVNLAGKKKQQKYKNPLQGKCKKHLGRKVLLNHINKY